MPDDPGPPPQSDLIESEHRSSSTLPITRVGGPSEKTMNGQNTNEGNRAAARDSELTSGSAGYPLFWLDVTSSFAADLRFT